MVHLYYDGALLALASGKAERRQVHPLKKTLRNRNNIAAGHAVMSGGYTLLYIGGFKGVHLRYFNIARLVHLRQVHPLNLLYDLLASYDVDALAKC